jgi:hypothetical protein
MSHAQPPGMLEHLRVDFQRLANEDFHYEWAARLLLFSGGDYLELHTHVLWR